MDILKTLFAATEIHIWTNWKLNKIYHVLKSTDSNIEANNVRACTPFDTLIVFLSVLLKFEFLASFCIASSAAPLSLHHSARSQRQHQQVSRQRHARQGASSTIAW